MFKKNYSVSIGEDWVSPEETLLDSGSEHSNLEKPISREVFGFIFIFFAILFMVVLGFSFKISIIDNFYLSTIALQNKSVNFLIPPPRGVILDRFGKPLVKNVPSFDLLVVSREARENQSEERLKKIAEILKISYEEFKTLISSGIADNSIFFASKDLTKEQVLSIKYLNPKGYHVVPSIRRNYIDGHQFSQVVGYVGKVNKDELQDSYYFSTDVIGRLGVEAEYEEILRGEHGVIFFGKEDVETLNRDSVQGKNLVLNIDYDLQKKLYNELYGILVSSNLSRGAAIIQNPQNGSVLAMVSFPSFDNNLFVSGLSSNDFKKLFENKAKPLFNRVISGLYNPGSTIKPLIGMMALEEKIFSPQDVIRDCVSLTVPNQFNSDSSYVFKNWRQDLGLFNLRKAIAQSCNIYFFIAGGGFGNIQGLGAERIVKYLTASKTDSVLGIDLPGEEKGFVPSPDWKVKTRGENWYQGDTYNISIGQGDLLVTPLWLNSYISAIANGGTIYEPKVAQRVLGNYNDFIESFEPEVVGKLPFSNEVIKEMKSDMQETITSGTASLLRDLPVKAGAKTGTAEVVKGSSINSLFTAFAPFDNPEISITVLVEGSASNQGLAIRSAHNVLKWYFGRSASSSE